MLSSGEMKYSYVGFGAPPKGLGKLLSLFLMPQLQLEQVEHPTSHIPTPI